MHSEANAWMAQEIFKILSGLGHEIFMYDSGGKRVYDADEATYLFSNDVKLMTQLGETKGSSSKPLVKFYCSKTTPIRLVNQLKRTLKKHNLYDHSFDTYIYGRVLEPKHFSRLAKEEDLTESAWTGSTRTSRQRIGETELVIRHSKPLADVETSPRWMRIRDMFIHAPDGSRWRCPWKHILSARAMAQHMDQGNTPWDTRGAAIDQLARTLLSMRRLRRWLATSGDESMQQHALQAVDHIKHLLRCVADANKYEDGINQAETVCDGWRNITPRTDGWPEGMDEAVQVLEYRMQEDLLVPHKDHEPVDNLHARDHEHHEDRDDPDGSWPEERALNDWFNQFDVSRLEEDDFSDVKAAAEEEDSEDPRTVLNNLRDNVVGWDQRFEDDPKEALDSIESALAKLQKELD